MKGMTNGLTMYGWTNIPIPKYVPSYDRCIKIVFWEQGKPELGLVLLTLSWDKNMSNQPQFSNAASDWLPAYHKPH